MPGPALDAEIIKVNRLCPGIDTSRSLNEHSKVTHGYLGKNTLDMEMT